MPEMILAGPDGQPAIDAETGQPATMEELLRRRGILYRGGARDVAGSSTPSVVPNTTSPVATPNTASAGPAVAALVARNGVNVAGNGMSSANSASGGAGMSADSAVNPETLAQLEADGVDEQGAIDLETAGLIAVGTAAAYAAYRMMKGRGGPSVTSSTSNMSPSTALSTQVQPSAANAVIDETIQGKSPPMKMLPPPSSSAAPSATESPKQVSSVKQLAENKKRATARTKSQGTTLPNDAKPQAGYKASDKMTSGKYDQKSSQLTSGTMQKTESEVAKQLKARKLPPKTIQTVLKAIF